MQQEQSLAGYEEAMACHLGDFREYFGIRRELTDLERKGSRMETASNSDREKRQRQLAALRKRMKDHPCHRCTEREQHARWAERWWKLKRDTDKLRSQIQSRTGAVAKVFDRVSEVLLELGYLTDEGGETALTVHGRTLKRIYGERDLLVAECLRRNVWKDLDAAGLAAMACALVFEPRRDEGLANDRTLPRGAFRPALEKTVTLWSRLDDLEQDNRLPGREPPSTAISLAMWMWSRGQGLDAVLTEADMAAGDFVRWAKQTIDLLDQLSLVAQGNVGRVARQALESIRRGIVAYSSVS
jgi:ATP-dependent RNA helicase HelY